MSSDTKMGKQTLIGSFVLGGVALGIFALVAFGNVRLFSKSDHAVIIFQDSVGGLSVGAPVTFRGVRVGSVDSVTLRFDPATHHAYIPVKITLEPERIDVMPQSGHTTHAVDLREAIAHGLRAEQNMQSFVTGTLNINLDFFPGSPAVLHPRVSKMLEIPTHQSTIQKLQNNLQDIPLKELATNANEAVIEIRNIARKLDDQMPSFLASLQQTSQDAQLTLNTATHAITSWEKQLNVTLSDIDRLVTVGTTQLQNRGTDLHAALIGATQTTDAAKKTLEEVKTMLAPRSSERENLDATLRDVAAAASALRGFANDVERNPQLLLMGRR